MSDCDIAFFCHGDDGEFTVAHLICLFEDGLFELCALHHSPADSSEMKWRVKKLESPEDMKFNPGSYWKADTTFYIDGCLCWVDYYHGMLLVDVLLANSDSKSSPEDQQQLIRYIPLPELALESSRQYMDPFTPDLFRHVCVTDEDAGIVKLVCIFTERFQPTFTIITWSLDIHKGSWNKDPSTVIRDSDFFRMYDAAHSHLPRVKPSFPVVSLADPDVICFLLQDDDHVEHDNTYWGIEIDMKKKVLLSTALYIREEEEEGYCLEKKPARWMFYGQHFVTSRFTSYFGEVNFKSREISIRMEKEARQRLARG